MMEIQATCMWAFLKTHFFRAPVKKTKKKSGGTLRFKGNKEAATRTLSVITRRPISGLKKDRNDQKRL